jgi:SAM-dependent methyltransferase
LRALRLTYLAPCDCRKLDMPGGSIDVITSRAVLEHIPPAVITDIFKESLRVLKPGGAACHFVDNSDHWEFEDKTISRTNFLQFSDSVFRLTCLNAQHYQNRLRHSEYVDGLQATGFDLVRAEREVDMKSVATLKQMSVDRRFLKFGVEDLATITSYLLALKPKTA